MSKLVFIIVISIIIMFSSCNKNGTELKNNYQAGVDTIYISSDTTLVDTIFTVTFNTNGGNEIAPIKVKKGEHLASFGVKDPIMEEHTFLFWTLDGGMYNIYNEITEDITLEASWKSLNWEVKNISGKDGVKIIKYIGDKTDSISVPSIIEGKKVLEIYSFYPMKEVDVERINKLTYLDCSVAVYLSSISGFYDCKNLTHVLFPNNLKKIKDTAFKNTNIEILDLSNTQVTTIERLAFDRCKNLDSIIFPNTLEYIGKYAFQQGTHKLKHLTFPKSLKAIDEKAFTTCYGLETIRVTRAVEGDLTRLVGFEPFHVCDNITTKYYPKGSKYKEDEVELGWVSEDTGEPVAGAWVEY